MPHPTLLEGIASLRPSDRARLSHLEITPTENGWQVTLHALDSVIGQGELDAEPTLEQQATALADSGLCGGITWSENKGARLVWLWSATPAQRAAWQARQDRGASSPEAFAVLVAGDAVRAAGWRHRQALAALSDAALSLAGTVDVDRAAIAVLAGVDPGDVAELARPEVPAPATAAEVVALPRERTQPCAYCGLPATDLVGGVPLHLGECRAAFQRGDVPARTARLPERDSGPAATHQERVEPAPQATPSPARERQTKTAAATAGPDFAAPAVAIDGERWYLPDGTSGPWEAAHLGEVALLAQQLQLGWGKRGDGRFTDEGQVWLYPGALQRLGLPVDLNLPEDGDEAALRKAKSETLTTLNDRPAVAAALQAGWRMGSGGHLDTWTKIWHPELLRHGARLVSLPWNRVEGVALLQDETQTEQGELDFTDATPQQLVARLLEFAQLVGISYRISPPTTAMDLIDQHRPPRRTADDRVGQSRNRVSLIKDQQAQLPPLFRATGDTRFRTPEADYDWWRPWASLTRAEQAGKYAVAFDRNAAYLAPWSSIELGVEGLRHDLGVDAGWAGDELPAFYLIDRVDWPEWWLPSPIGRRAAFVDEDRVWVSVHTMRQLARGGVTPRVHEAYRWEVHARYLQGPAKVISTARLAASDQVLDTVKSLYKGAVGRFRKTLPPTECIHLWRPDWAALIIAQNRTGIQHTLRTVQAASGAVPLVVSRDTIIYALHEPAWPGQDNQFGPATGAWKLAGQVPLAQWGPKYLPEAGGSWRYVQAMDEMVLTSAALTQADPARGSGHR